MSKEMDDQDGELFMPSGQTLSAEECARLQILTPEKIEVALNDGQRDRRAAQSHASAPIDPTRYRR
ncbi:MAG: hypothetical protein EXS55_02005 [Candidatus Magasanikbacteria bacterium]|nr:hypothetical protein [Candidatus Magasanikbacteria bacterium]